MKKVLSVTIIGLLVFLLCSCGADDSSEAVSFPALIKEVDSNTITVIPDIMSPEYKISDTFSVTINEGTLLTDSEGNTIKFSDIQVDQEVYITYDGLVSETYPAQITASEISLRTIVIKNIVDTKKNTITANFAGSTKTITADRVALKGCYILVPADGWVCQSVKETKVGPLVIYPKKDDSVSVAFRVIELADIENAKEQIFSAFSLVEDYITKSEISDNDYTAVIKSDDNIAYVHLVRIGTDVASVVCRYPVEMAEDYGNLTEQIANSIHSV